MDLINAPTSKIICKKCLEEVEGDHQKYADVKQTIFRIPPSIKAKKDMIIRTIQNLPFPVSEIILEDVYFDFQAMENPNITGEQYQQGPLLYHKNFKQACLVRDDFKCRYCESKKQLQCHHKKTKSKKGTDKLSNLMTLCKQCHKDYHAAKQLCQELRSLLQLQLLMCNKVRIISKKNWIKMLL